MCVSVSFFQIVRKIKKIHDSGYRNRYAMAFTPRNCNRATATVTATATAFQNLAWKSPYIRCSSFPCPLQPVMLAESLCSSLP